MATENVFELSPQNYVASSPNPLYNRQSQAMQASSLNNKAKTIHDKTSKGLNEGKITRQNFAKLHIADQRLGALPTMNCPEKIVC